MHGQYLEIGGRKTYFPPFVNERFGGRPYWACTFASLLNGVNVAWRGQKPATADEIRALARASGDVDLRGGSRSSHMITAMRVRYGQRMAIERLTPERAKKRLASGWAMVAGVTYAALPDTHRRWSPHFKAGHRVVVLGWDDGRMRILDPMADRDHSYGGQWIQWSEFEPAWWSGEQLWFREGMGLPGPAVKTLRIFAPPRHFKVAGGTTVSARSASDPRNVVRATRILRDSGAAFDAVMEAGTKRYVRVANGLFAGLLIDPGAPGITADIGDDAPGAKPSAGGAGAAGAGAAPNGRAGPSALENVTLAARQAEWDRIKKEIDAGKPLPPRP
ncbi:MAG: hypothetical protein H0V73_05275 [Chloroflexi bacterium]|nr:hypothetical protein [Chloroflexota bacterium]